MPVFETPDLLRFYNQGENDFTQDYPLLYDRYSIPTVSGTGEYSIPDYIQSISRVTYQGKKLDPLPFRSMRDAFQPSNQVGRPFWYVFNNIGQNKIKLFPIPNETIAAATDGLWDTAIRGSVIIEFARVTDNQDFILPDWARDFVLKQYVGKMVFKIEGPGQNLKMSQYYANRWDLWSNELRALLEELYSNSRKMYISNFENNNWFPGSPMLPIDRFGIGVETGF